MQSNLLQWLDDYCPNKVPTSQLTEWEYGVLAGQRLLIEHIKYKLKVEENKNVTNK